MKYFYIHPYKPQYFFPEGFESHKVFVSFFKPYSLKGKISWFLFLKFSLYRFFFKKKNIEEFIPEIKIRKIINSESSIAFNSGTAGPEQKITGLGLQNNGRFFFLKYAQSSLGIKNVINEHYILKNLQGLDFVPKIQNFYKDDTQTLLKTDVLSGNRLGNIPLNETILNCLFILSEQSVKSQNKTKSNLKFIFAHGDFCPWNMMEKNKKILLFDWEMGGNYPVGYDFFTYIFQTNFLLNPNKSISEIMLENKNNMKLYFKYFNIYDWNNYLLEFILLKIDLETKKREHSKAVLYENLLNFVKINNKT
jgi:hypothetical protein